MGFRTHYFLQYYIPGFPRGLEPSWAFQTFSSEISAIKHKQSLDTNNDQLWKVDMKHKKRAEGIFQSIDVWLMIFTKWKLLCTIYKAGDLFWQSSHNVLWYTNIKKSRSWLKIIKVWNCQSNILFYGWKEIKSHSSLD